MKTSVPLPSCKPLGQWNRTQKSHLPFLRHHSPENPSAGEPRSRPRLRWETLQPECPKPSPPLRPANLFRAQDSVPAGNAHQPADLPYERRLPGLRIECAHLAEDESSN